MQGHRPFHDAVQATDFAKERAKELRDRLSPPEGILWSRLRRNQIEGLRFRRQHGLGPYIADFYCHEAALVVEVDGIDSHRGGSYLHDRERDLWMAERRLLVLRITASDVTTALDRVVERIRVAAVRRLDELDPYRRDETSPGEP